MAFRTVLLPIRESEVAESLIDTCIGIAKRQSAHVDLLYVHPDPEATMPYATIGLSQGMRRSIREAATSGSQAEADRLRALFERRCEAGGLAVRPRGAAPGEPGADLLEAHGRRSEEIARHGRLADLLVVPRPFRTNPPPSSFESVLRETGRPVLMIPRLSVPQVIGRKVLVGWNGSKEAAQAVAAALPCIAGSEVHVVSSEKRMKQRPNGDDLAVYLACHGIEADVRVFGPTRESVGATLVSVGRELGIDLMIVGGYSRARLRELVVGGVTGHLIEHAEVPVLMVH